MCPYNIKSFRFLCNTTFKRNLWICGNVSKNWNAIECCIKEKQNLVLTTLQYLLEAWNNIPISKYILFCQKNYSDCVVNSFLFNFAGGSLFSVLNCVHSKAQRNRLTEENSTAWRIRYTMQPTNNISAVEHK